jgi:enoyl-CoA hydratase/carnithine racemase
MKRVTHRYHPTSRIIKSFSTIETRREGKVAILTLNRPKKKNAFSHAMYTELQDTLKSLNKEEDCRSIVLTGKGDFYSSGNDLSNFRFIIFTFLPETLTEPHSLLYYIILYYTLRHQ